MCFVYFMLDSLAIFSMSIKLMLSWWNSMSSTEYPCPSMKHLDHRHCGNAFSDPTILDFVELPLFIFCFHDISIIDPDPMGIIAPVRPLQSGLSAKDASNHHLITLRLSTLRMSGRCRVPLMYLSTLTRFPQTSLYGIPNQVHRKVMYILMSFLSLDVTKRTCTTMWWNAVACSLSSSYRSSSGLT